MDATSGAPGIGPGPAAPIDPELTLAPSLAIRGARRTFRRGDVLFLEGDVSQRVFVLERGWVKLTCSLGSDRDVPLRVAGAGEILENLSSVSPRHCSAVALGRVEASVVSAAELERVLDEVPGAARELLTIMGARLREAELRAVEYVALDTLGRVCARLLDLHKRFGRRTASGVAIELPISQKELAWWCGSSREATVRALRTLRDLGEVSTGRGTLVVHDAGALRRHAMVQSP